jgi:hypothetical protein
MKTSITFNKVINDAGQLALIEGHTVLTSSPRVTPCGLLSFEGDIVKTQNLTRVGSLIREDLLLATVTVELVVKKNGEHRGFRYTLHLKDREDGIVIRKCSARIYENAYYSEYYTTPYAWSFGKKFNQPPQYKLIKEIPVTKKPCVIAYEAERQESIERHREARQQNEISPSYLRPIFKSPLTSNTER